MNGEINKNWYCSADCYDDGKCTMCFMDTDYDGDDLCSLVCKNYHRKWPTLEQFALEYREKYKDEWAIYTRNKGPNKFDIPDYLKWEVCSYLQFKNYLKIFDKENIRDTFDVVCACTPAGIPPDNWKPQSMKKKQSARFIEKHPRIKEKSHGKKQAS